MEKALTVVSKIQFIKNAKVPVCFDCAYFIPGAHKLSRCSKFGEKDVVTGKVTYASAENSRLIENMCSRKGIYFENKHNL
jgi:hypothetical protein